MLAVDYIPCLKIRYSIVLMNVLAVCKLHTSVYSFVSRSTQLQQISDWLTATTSQTGGMVIEARVLDKCTFQHTNLEWTLDIPSFYQTPSCSKLFRYQFRVCVPSQLLAYVSRLSSSGLHVAAIYARAPAQYHVTQRATVGANVKVHAVFRTYCIVLSRPSQLLVLRCTTSIMLFF